MSDIQRYTMRGATRHNGGDFVTYADHVAALAQARAETRYANALVNEQAKRDALAKLEAELLDDAPYYIKREEVRTAIAAIKAHTTRADEERRQALERGEMA